MATSPPLRRRLLALTTLLLPCLALAALEGGLRLAGIGRDLPLFADAPKQPGYRSAQRDVARRFQPTPGGALLTKIDEIYFRAIKPADGLRIFVQGSSTAAGFPYGPFASLSGMLEQRLEVSFPGRRVEVVQTAMSAVNSYAFVDFADEILAESPDAIAIYGGHNEYLGLLGVGSTISAGRALAVTRAYLALRPLRLFQLLQHAVAAARRALADPVAPEAGISTLMQTVAGEKQIPLGGALYERGLEQLRSNLERLLSRYAEAGVPVFIGTLACNERDHPPFDGRPAPGSAPGDSADAWFARARELDAAGDFAAARRAYLEAKDRDQLRFRAPEAANQVIREVAEHHGAIVVETQRALALASPGGIIGKELMLEHLHPNLRGYFLLADAFYDAIAASGRLGAFERQLPEDSAWEQQPLTELDRLAGEYRIAVLRSHWPFQPEGHTPPPPPPSEDPLARLAQRMAERELSWTEAVRSALALAEERGDAREAARIADDLATVYPRSAPSQALAASWLAKTGRSDDALQRIERARELDPENPKYLHLHSSLQLQSLLEEPAESR